MSRYDEDLYENPFFMVLEKNFSTLFEEATACRWIVCIPRCSAVISESLTNTDFQDHILKPLSGSSYQTVSGHEVTISDGQINLGKGFHQSKKVRILFEETFYNSKDESYRVLCISCMFNRKSDTQDISSDDKKGTISKPPSNYDDCLNILWRNAGTSKTKENFDKVLTGFCVQYQKLAGENIEVLAEMVSSQLTQAMQTVLKDQNIRRSVQQDDASMTNLKIAVEMYMMNAVHKHLFSTIQLYTKSADATINKKTRNLVDIRLHQLGVRKEFEENLPGAKKELAMLNQYSTPVGRLLCIKRVFAAITKPLKESEGIVMTTDDLLPLLIYLIIKSQIPNWSTNLMYMKYFQQVTLLDKDELSFYLATVEAALNYISADELRADSQKLAPVSRPPGNHDILKRQISGGTTSTKEKFFQYVQYGDESAVRLMLKKADQSEEDISSELCHPLCDCVKCADIVQRSKQTSNKFSINARDDMGRIALHIAAFYGRATLIDVLVKNGSLTDATDYMGYTPLHLACQKGFQNIILLLVHFGSEICAVDNEGNTPLHLCAKNGHEDCVKAILFLDILKNKLNVNAKNDMGDTPLHLAAKWGYEGIVRFLLESEANPLTRNRKRQTPLDVAQNPSIKQQLQTACEEPLPMFVPYATSLTQMYLTTFQLHEPSPIPATPPTSVHSSHITNRRPSHTTPEASTTSVQPKTPQGYVLIEPEKGIKSSVPLVDSSSKAMMAPTSTPVTNLDSVYLGQIEKLYKAIANKDLPLVKFYLGWSDLEDSDEDESPVCLENKTLCHPLCQCSKCHPLQKVNAGTCLSVNCQNRKGFSPLHISVIEKNMDAFKLFLRRRANANAKTSKNVTAMHLACYYGNLEMTKLLLKFGADVNAVDLHGEIPLHLACAKRNPDLVLFLIQSSSQVNRANIMGNTPLHLATSHNATDVVRILLQNGADRDLKNKDGQSPYHLTKSPDVQKLLMKRAEDVMAAMNPETKREDTPESDGSKSTEVPLKNAAETLTATDSKLLEDIKAFDKTSSLKRSKTFDHSTALLDSPELKLSLSIKSFDKSLCLKHSKTFDRSEAVLWNLRRNFAIQSFDSLTLKHVDLVDKSNPLHLYYLAQSCYKDYKDEIPLDFETKTVSREHGDSIVSDLEPKNDEKEANSFHDINCSDVNPENLKDIADSTDGPCEETQGLSSQLENKTILDDTCGNTVINLDKPLNYCDIENDNKHVIKYVIEDKFSSEDTSVNFREDSVSFINHGLTEITGGISKEIESENITSNGICY